MRLTSTNFVLPPTVIRLTPSPSVTTNDERTVQPGYWLGEHMSVRAANGSVYALWGMTHSSPPSRGRRRDVDYRRAHDQPTVEALVIEREALSLDRFE